MSDSTSGSRPSECSPKKTRIPATLKAVRYAHALRGFDGSGAQVPAEEVSTNDDSKHYYYLV